MRIVHVQLAFIVANHQQGMAGAVRPVRQLTSAHKHDHWMSLLQHRLQASQVRFAVDDIQIPTGQQANICGRRAERTDPQQP
jgi:hypothetical protein